MIFQSLAGQLLLALCLASGADGGERSVTQAEPHSCKSRVPSYAFAGERTEQEAQLKTNSLMLRFAESRNKLSADPYRPIYHYVNPESALNDPNGRRCVALRVYPGRADSTGVSLRAQGRDAELKSLDAWQMESIHE